MSTQLAPRLARVDGVSASEIVHKAKTGPVRAVTKKGIVDDLDAVALAIAVGRGEITTTQAAHACDFAAKNRSSVYPTLIRGLRIAMERGLLVENLAPVEATP